MAVELVVEDEPFLRMRAVDLVEEAGFQALEAENADQALQLLETRNDVRVILTDIDMPGSMDGLKLAAAVKDRWPPIEIIVVSGQYDVATVKLPTGVLFFPKPYPEDQLISAMRASAA